VVLDDILQRIDRTHAPLRGTTFRRLKHGWYALPAWVRESTPVLRLQRWARPRLHQAMLVPDRRRRRYFAIPNDRYAGAVRINLRGRETSGVVEPAAYAATCDEVRDALGALVDAETGEPAVQALFDPCRSLSGAHRDALPDLVVEWQRTRAMRTVGAPRLGTWTLPAIVDRTGDHRNEGLVVAVGPGLAPRHLDVPVAIEDLAPTIAALAGVTLPSTDGRPIAAIVGDDAGSARSPSR
jgi:predicted AlkP superfamily phosphohydrolase/phosphomutase